MSERGCADCKGADGRAWSEGIRVPAPNPTNSRGHGINERE
jgi:hypothetical protein